MRLVYAELRRVATGKIAMEGPGATLQATELVHEAWLRLGADEQPKWQNRAHFFGAAAEAMRRILIDRARKRKAQRRGAGQVVLNVDEHDVAVPLDDDRLLAMNEVLEKFAAADPRKAELVKLRYFAGLTIEEAASTMGISDATAKRWWVYARAWFNRELAGELKPGA